MNSSPLSTPPARPARRGALLLLTATALALLAMPAGSQAGSQPKVKPRPPFLPPYDVINAVDATKGTITVGHVNSTDKSPETYTFSRLCQFEVKGEKATAADLKPGMKVSVNAGMSAGQADRVTAGPTPAPPPQPATAKGKVKGKKG